MQNMIESMNSFIKNQSENPWDTAIFGDIYHLSNDARGKFGEQIISSLLHILDWEIQNDVSDETIRADGHYDIKANNLRLEVKTACYGTCGAWQHEPLYDNAVFNACDYVVFLDFHYNHYYLTVCKSIDLPLGGRSNIPMFGNKHGTLRKNKDNGYKFDFSNTTIKNVLNAGICKQFSAEDSLNTVAEWFNECFKEK